MIKLKELLKEEKETINEADTGWKLYKHPTIDSKMWRAMKYDLRDQIDEVIKIGEDYAVFQAPKFVMKTLKQIKRLMDKL
jgi:fatty acid/phospholipid biosynthesis enzyme